MSSNDTVGYETFLPLIIGAIQEKVKKEEQLSDNETRSIIATQFKLAVREIAQRTSDMTVETPISVYPESRHYPINPPDGFLSIRVVPPILVQDYALPKGARLCNTTLELPCCPSKQVTNAYYAMLAVMPKMTSDICEFDVRFIEEHYDTIHTQMLAQLTQQPARQWKSLGLSDRLKREVNDKIKAWKAREYSQQPIRMTQERLTDGIHTTPACSKG